MSKAEYESINNEGIVWRCDPCSATRLSSLRLQAQATEGTLTYKGFFHPVRDVGNALGMKIEESMIEACHLLDKIPDFSGPTNIIVKFIRRLDAEAMLAKRRA
ncbi:hypothetical protein J6590_094621 [Homalodisca vitripennis]|nr:hypothetical protein J6590_094621 [Homalodisca vitripennis]